MSSASDSSERESSRSHSGDSASSDGRCPASSVASAPLQRQFVTLTARFKRHTETLYATSDTSLADIGRLLLKAGGWDSGHLGGWFLPPPPLPAEEKRELVQELRDEQCYANRVRDYDRMMRLANELRDLREGPPAKRVDRHVTLAELHLPPKLLFAYDLGACNEVQLELTATRRLDDAAVQAHPRLPCIQHWQPRVAAALPQGVTAFDAAFPSLCAAMACAAAGQSAGRGFTLGRMVCDDGPTTDLELWTPNDLVIWIKMPKAGGGFDAPRLRAVLETAEERCAVALKRWQAGRHYTWDYDSVDYDPAADGDDENENDDDNADTEPAAKRPRQEAPPPRPAYDFCAAFPAVADLLLSRGALGAGAARQPWLHFESGVLRLYRGVWRGPRGVLNLGQYKQAAWVASRRYTTVHAALAELETHLTTKTARGRQLAAPAARAAKEAAQFAKRQAQMAADNAKAAARRAKARAREEAAAAKAAARAAREAARAEREAAKAAREQARAAKARLLGAC